MLNTLTYLKDPDTIKPIFWDGETESIKVIDQRLLPNEYKIIEIKTVQEMTDAIKNMTVRGAPLIGISAAFGMVLAAKNKTDFCEADKLLRESRPTAVNLMWALDEMQALLKTCELDDIKTIYKKFLTKALWILEDDIQRCLLMSELAANYIQNLFSQKISQKQKLKIITHCNAGALATGGYGTALGVIRTLADRDLVEMVFVDETRPRQQGARLTAWELAHDKIPATLITDNMAAHIMQDHAVDFIVTGADRIAANGDAANKIGTYGLAIVAKYHQVPFFIAAPESTIDKALADGKLIPIEERCHTEVTIINDNYCTVESGINICNPAFDVTPRELITEIFTEKGRF